MFGLDIPWYIWIPIIALSIFASFRAITDTNGAPKTAAYLLLIIALPVFGALIYFSVGINYRKNKIFSKKILNNEELADKIKHQILTETSMLRKKYTLSESSNEVIDFLVNDSFTPLTENKVIALQNGEEKFPEVKKALQSAKVFIHIEYYVFEDGQIGNELADILIQKAGEGVEIRVIFDDYGSKGSSSMFKRMRKAGIKTCAFHKAYIYNFTQRITYRDHRKIIIVDGKVGFLGGINVADRYINNGDDNKFYWRDMHLKIEGEAVKSIQQYFISNWNFCSGEKLEVSRKFFPELEKTPDTDKLVQIVGGGPDYPRSSLMLSVFAAIAEAKHTIYITTPYFIPNETLQNALIRAAVSGKDVCLLVPDKSDTKLVNYASQFYFQQMLQAGVRIFRYQKGFVHAKALVVDDDFSMVGSANMDLRSFEVNFEINAIVYSEEFNTHLKEVFANDLKDSEEIDKEEWSKRSKIYVFRDSLARIVSPLL